MSSGNQNTQLLKAFLFQIGDLTSFTFNFFRQIFIKPFEFNEIVRQMFILGYRSLFLVTTSSFIIGLVMTLHMIPVMRKYGVEAMVPNMAALSIVREIGPVLTSLVCAGKIGSSIGAEIGSMKVTDQIDAMYISGVDAYHFLVMTRVIATTICVPLLIIFGAAVGMVGAFIAENLQGKMSAPLFITSSFGFFYFHDVIPSVIKSILFGFIIGIVGCFYGFRTTKGAAGVGKASHASVVSSSLLIFFVDMLVVEVAQLFY